MSEAKRRREAAIVAMPVTRHDAEARQEDERQMKAFATAGAAMVAIHEPLKERSARIVYLDAAAAGLIAPPPDREWRLVDGGRGRFALATKNKDGRWGISPSAIVDVSEVPAVGKIPLELWEHEIIHGKIAYRKARLGNAIITTAIN
jgi:hypothetical protein